MKSYLRLKQDEFATRFLEKNWADDWPDVWTPEEVAFYDGILKEKNIRLDTLPKFLMRFRLK